MSEFRRRLMSQVATSGEVLPVGCVRCEYLESFLDISGSNGQYIDTERVVGNSDIIELKFGIRSGNSTKTMFGWRWYGNYATNNHCYINTYLSYFQLGYGNKADDTNIPFVADSVNSLYINPNTKEVLVNNVVDKTTRDFSSPYNNGTSVYNPYLFTANNIGVPYSGCNARIYDYLVKDKDGIEVQHLVPILDQDGIPCMYDLVGKRFHYNARTNRQDPFLYKIAE